MSEKTDGNAIPQLGMAAAAFACFLVTVSIPTPSDELRRAVDIFAVCIPIVVAGPFLRRIRRDVHKQWLKSALQGLIFSCAAVGDIGCAIGIYRVFRHVSFSAARLFLITAVACWLGVGLIDLLATAVERKKESEQANG